MAMRRVPKHLPYSTGPYAPGCVDIMTEYSREGLFARIYYPTEQADLEDHCSRWISWLPHDKYVIGFAYILKLWTFLIRLLMKYVAGDIKIPVIENEKLNKNIGKLRTVVFSHGLGGTRFLYSNICCELASHGFVVIALEHRDGSSSMTCYYESKESVIKQKPTWMKVKRVNVGGLEHFPTRKAQVEKRSSECKRALDLLEKLNNGEDIGNILDNDFDLKQFKGLLDFSKCIMMGHSFGGATALLTLGTDSRFGVGVILDPWMFSIKSHKDLPNMITQPLLFVNTQTFHILANLKELEKYTVRKNTEKYTIRKTTHENQSDTVHVIGYWLNIFMRKINKTIASKINNCLILNFLRKHLEFLESTNAEEYLKTQSSYIVEDIAVEGVYNKPKRIPQICSPLHCPSRICSDFAAIVESRGIGVLSTPPPPSEAERPRREVDELVDKRGRAAEDGVRPINVRNSLNGVIREQGDLRIPPGCGVVQLLHRSLSREGDAEIIPGNGVTVVKTPSQREVRVNVLSEAAMPALDRSNNGALALHYAAARGCLDCVRLLTQTSDLSANTQMDNDVTPVYLAAQEGHLEVLKFLVLEAGGSLYVRAKDGMAPVHAAAQMGCLTCLKWMVQEQGVDPNLRDGDGATPLHFAASRGHIDTVRWLLRHGGKLSLDKYGKSPINDAAENQQIECLNILVQHGTVPDYQEESHVNGKLHGCVCRKGDPQQKCSYSDCVNFSSPRAPFFLHSPGRDDYPSHDGLYINPMTNNHDSGSSVSSGSSESFFLHNPQDVVYNRVKDLFEGTRNEVTPVNGLTVKVEVHSSSSGAGSEENLSSSDMSERSEEQEHDYEDIYHLSEANLKKNERNRHGDSGSHSRSGSLSSINSTGIIVKLTSQDRPSMTSTAESGMSSASPSDLGHSEEESEKTKISHRHSLPHHNVFSRQLKRVISEPGNSCPPPPPPPPLPPLTVVSEVPKISAKSVSASSTASTENNGTNASDQPNKVIKTNGTRQNGYGSEEASETENTSSGPGLVNKKLVLPFIPPTFSVHGEDCLIKPSEYLKSIGGTRSISNSFLHKTYTKCQEHKGNEPDNSKVRETNGPQPPPPPPPPLLDFAQKETTADQESGGTSGKPKVQHQPLSAISIHDLNSVQLRRTALQKTMSTPVKTLQQGGEPFQAQKQDLIAELKLSKDIEGVKKMKVERLKTEEKQEKELVSEIARQLNANTLLEKIPEKDSTGNPIPPWKRQMMAKKAAEKARRDLEEQMKKEAEEKRIQAIPAWKRQLIAKKEENENKSTVYIPKLVEEKKVPQVMLKVSEIIQTVTVPSIEISLAEDNNKENSRPQTKQKNVGDQIADEDEKIAEGEDDTTQIIPWRAQLRKTNSKLSLLD